METSFDTSERGTLDFVIFGMMFYGFLITAGGIVLMSIGVTIAGALLLGFGALGLLVSEGC